MNSLFPQALLMGNRSAISLFVVIFLIGAWLASDVSVLDATDAPRHRTFAKLTPVVAAPNADDEEDDDELEQEKEEG